MFMKDIVVRKGNLELTLCQPSFEDGYYRGTRFDHSGIFRRIVKGGFFIAQEWFDGYDPYRHDTVCGASEEFDQSGYEQSNPGQVFLKPGVGLLVKDDVTYDHFKLYDVKDTGKWTVTSNDTEARFIHVIDADEWGYVYEKVVRVLDEGSFEITHRLCNTGTRRIEGKTYNHNFFTFGSSRPGPDIEIDFPFTPCGNWRSEYDSVELSEKGIRFLRPLQKGESVFMGNLAPVDGKKVTGEVFSMSSAGYKVIFESDRIFDHITFWSNHRVACIEPFISYCLESGEEFEWTYKFRIM